MMRNKWLFLLVLVGAIALTGCGASSSDPQATPLPPVKRSENVLAEGRVIPRDSAVLVFSAGGPVEQILVSEGAQVPSGTELVRLGNREQALAAVSMARLEQVAAQQSLDQLTRLADLGRGQAALKLAEAERLLILAQKAYDDLDTDAIREDLDDKKVAVQDAKDAVEDAQEEADKYKDLDLDNATRKNAEQKLEDAQKELQDAIYERDLLQNDLDKAQAALDQAEYNVIEARRAYEARLDGPDADELELAQARAENADRQLAAAEKMLENFTLVAPYDGRVMEIKNLQVGEWVSPAQPAIVFADVSVWYVETKDLDEMDVVKLEIGQGAKIVLDGLAEVELTGTVEWIGETFSEKSGDVLYTVRIRLNDTDTRMRWGMTVQITFD